MTDPVFPGIKAFDGGYTPAASPVQDGGQSTYDGAIALTMLDAGLIDAVLPADLQRAERNDSGTTHPVLCLVGHQRDPLLVQHGTLQPSYDPGYQEMILLIPFVLHRPSGTLWHSFAVRMYLNDVAAIAIGNGVYAYSKQFAALPESGPPTHRTTGILPLLQGEAFRSEFSLTGAWASAAGAPSGLPNWPALQTIFAMPLVGQREPPLPTAPVCSYWEWDYSSAEVAPATATWTVLQPLRAGMAAWVTAGPFASAPNGALLIRKLRWRLAIPPPACQF